MISEENKTIIEKFDPIVKPLTSDCAMYLNGFCCGVETLDTYISDYSLKHLENGNGVTYIIIDRALNTLVGYYTLSSTAITSGTNVLLSAVSIDMFAISKDCQDKFIIIDGVETLISDYFLWLLIGDIYVMSSSIVGVKYIVLHALPRAFDFYDRNSFIEVTDDIVKTHERDIDCIPMVFPLYNSEDDNIKLD